MRRKHVVYLLRSNKHPGQRYIGVTGNLDQRVADHNSGKAPHTRKYRPWSVVAAFWFRDQERALAFERYLKSGSGQAFANKRFW
jgi:predicted GIY-YIG superfamily endonuclease